MGEPFAPPWLALPPAPATGPSVPELAPPLEASRPTSTAAAHPPQREAGPLRVFVVDDNDGFREMLIVLLTTSGHQVVGEATDGAQALDLVAGLEPDVVLMDVRMPVLDGIETTRRLKAQHPEIGVVALTAQEDETIVREMLVAGASGYVLKDSDGEQILDAIAAAARGGAVLSPAVTPVVIEQLTEALDRERRRARELEEAHVALVERAARRHELVARLGHELRTPVTVILGVSRLLAGGQLDPEAQAEMMERLVGRAEALVRLVERFETATDSGSEDLVDVPALATEVAAPLRKVRVRAEPGTRLVWANQVLAQRILEEVLDNAVRFSPLDAPVEVSIRRYMGRLEVRVSDQGPGIPAEDRERVFEPLEQGEALDARVHQGAGVGLSLARAAARAMDGDLVIEDSTPAGSTFLWTVRLPPGG